MALMARPILSRATPLMAQTEARTPALEIQPMAQTAHLIRAQATRAMVQMEQIAHSLATQLTAIKLKSIRLNHPSSGTR